MPSCLHMEMMMSKLERFEPASVPGRLANRRGAEAKQNVASLIRSSGFQVSCRVPIGETIYGTRSFADLLIEYPPRWPDGLIVEVVSQSSAGSADQKFPYMVENIKRQYPCPTIVVLIGRGFGNGAVKWLRDQV